MEELLHSWLGRNGYLPHGYCFTWTPGLLWSMVTADAVIAASYYSIPLAMLHFAKRRRDVSFKWLVFMFSAFIFACGTTHLMSIWTIWRPDYGLETLVKVLTAVISAATAVALWPLIPKALRIPTVAQLQLLVDKLEREVAQRRAAQEQLAASEQSLEATLASIGAGFIATDVQGHVTHLNALAQRLTGWTEAEALGRPLSEVFVRELSEGVPAPVPSMAPRPPLPEAEAGAASARLLGRQGQSTPIEENASVVRDANGAPRGLVVVFRDMSDHYQAQEQARQHAELKLREMQLQAENLQYQHASRLKSEFLANMSHELRTPLNAIIGFSELLHAGKVPLPSPKAVEFLGHVRSSARHLLRLINDLLDLSKVESGTFQFFPAEVHLPGLIDEVVSILREAASRKGLEIDVSVDPVVAAVRLDGGRLKQVLYNYLSNAIKFTAPHGRVVLRAVPQGAHLFRLEVEDTGMGIAPEDIGRLFHEFTQLDAGPAKSQQGTGLGLALTKRLVEAQGGSVGVHSTPGVGSVFHAVLPRWIPAEQGDRGPHRYPAEAPAPAVLVVEDDPQDYQQLAQGLHLAGYDVTVATTGQQAIELVRDRRFGAITLDLLLPDVPGVGLLEAIREVPGHRETPVVVVSQVVEHPSAVAALGAADVLVKPVKPDDVVDVLIRLGVGPRAASPQEGGVP